MTAVARALHRDESGPKVFDDRLALQLAGPEGGEIAERLRTEVPAEMLMAFNRWVSVRARLTEDVVERAVEEGVRQYAILGAGLDSFAYRRADLLDRGLRVFEVDQPASQSWKQARLAEIGVQLPPNLIFAPVDFEHQTLRDGLEAAGFDLSAPAVFSWIGVTMYLTLDAIEATLVTVAECLPGTQIVLSYNLPISALPVAARGTGVFRRIAADMGEPFVSLFTPDEAAALLHRLGFVGLVDFGPAEALQTYFAGRDDVSLAEAQRLIVAKVAEPSN